ncbi:hypothetical protein CN074_21575 [Sinorhizobium medicae]|uniref:Uncharacterized protein n=1 Tax=Sinorhizobium medicae TaxID=110321 RepID=A0A6G1WJL2_9HYPH|nr:hypothetical protein [Sinorhizobium medicae]MDX0498675.1 hypothetical protein [Sinorhizobium medicae]MDX0548996.1 hypothetical protein [Sinorhizobium medicae]MDX0555158.1 hypothetical protein [Sinorhizobium medicae]MDX0573603.1 hypothetical protein [Sinorhizobium medicae]MDX0672484.1 hypothetical protein [Sinorhizobium medicae]
MLRRRGASLDTEGAAATDNPATIKGGTDGQVMVFTTTSDARDVTINYNTGNIFLKGGVDVMLGTSNVTITLIFSSSVTKWLET